MKLGLACYKYTDIGNTASGVVNVIIFAKGLVGGRWHYPSSEDPYDISVPTNGRLYVGFRSMCNVQKYHLAMKKSYLAGYAAGVDEKRSVRVSSEKEVVDNLNIYAEDFHHSKIAGAPIAHRKMQEMAKTLEALAREISLTEMIWFTSDLPYIVPQSSTFTLAHIVPKADKQLLNSEKG